MRVGDSTAFRVANRYVDAIVDAVELELGLSLSEGQVEKLTSGLELELSEAIQDVFGDLA